MNAYLSGAIEALKLLANFAKMYFLFIINPEVFPFVIISIIFGSASMVIFVKMGYFDIWFFIFDILNKRRNE